MSKDSLFYVADMLDAIEQLETALSETSFAQYEKDWVLRRATERGIEIVSEASRRIPADIKEQYSSIDWRVVAGIGNVLRHDYRDVSNEIIWNVFEVHLPTLKAALQTIRADLER
jgi:uncharacterized protein with HEPN domain